MTMVEYRHKMKLFIMRPVIVEQEDISIAMFLNGLKLI